ncbi:glycosyltransferase family 4 protein [Candidatus Kaiserbacteria bacterium]|nr:glycosyltransferase family 4 protein [Candidatus Kaiserbacteria bacterium]
MKRIAFVINSLVLGGAERVFKLETEELRARGFDVHMILLFRRGELSIGLPTENVHVLQVSSVFDVSGLLRFRSILRRLRPTIVYSTLNEANFASRLAALFLRGVRVFTREANMADVKPAIYKLSDIVLGFRSEKIIAVSSAVGASLIRYAPHLKNRIVTLYNPVRLPPPAERTPSEKLRILTVGSLTPKKDQEVLIRAMQALPETTTLTIVGAGAWREHLDRLVVELNLGKRVYFAGLIPHEEIDQVYRAHDIFVLPSKREGCPNVILEALSYRMPVVAFDIPGMKEFVKPGWGLFAARRTPEALRDVILSLVPSAQKRIGMGTAGFKHVSEHHALHVHVRDLIGILDSDSSTHAQII